MVNYLFYGDLEGLGYICVFLPGKNICPWRHSNCWLPNSFILGGGGILGSEMLVKCNFPVLPFKKKYINIFSNQWQLQAFQLAAHPGILSMIGIFYQNHILTVCSAPLVAGCVLFSQKPIYLRYVSKIAIFVPETHFCQGYRMGKASQSTQTCKVHKKIMWYSQTGTFIYPAPPNTLNNC